MSRKRMMERWIVAVETSDSEDPSYVLSYVKSLDGNPGGRTFDPMLADHWPTREEAIGEACAIRRETRGACRASAASVALVVEVIDADAHLEHWSKNTIPDRRRP